MNNTQITKEILSEYDTFLVLTLHINFQMVKHIQTFYTLI